MATYVNDLRLKEIATGDEAGTWGTSTNTNLELIAEAFSYGTEAITTNADTHTTTIADGSTDPGRSLYLKYTGTLDSACTITLGPNTVSKMWFIENATTGSQNIIISQGSGANITIPPGDVKVVYSDGAGSGAAVVDAFASLSVVDLKVQDDLTVTDDASVGGDLTVTGSIAGTLSTAAQTNITSVGTLTGLAVNGNTTLTTTDNSNTLTLISTDADAAVGPLLDLYRNSGSPADDDFIGKINFRGRNDNSQDVNYGSLAYFIQDASDGTEDAFMQISLMKGGSSHLLMEATSTETVFNQSSVDQDFRVESNGATHAIFVDAGNDRVGIACSSPSTALEVNNVSAGATVATFEGTYSASGDVKLASFERNGGAVAAAVTYADASTAIEFGTTTSHSLILTTGDTERMRIDTSGNLLLGTNSFNTGAFGSAKGINVSATQPIILVHESDTDKDGFMGISNSVMFLGTADAIPLRFSTNDAERMRISSAGLVSIGTTTTDRELKVQKSSDHSIIAAVSGTSSLAGMVMGDTSDDDRGAVLYNNNGDYLYFQANTVQYGQFNSTGEFHVTSGGNAIAPTTKHSGATGDVAKIRVINRSGQGANKGGLVELGAVTNDGVDRSDVLGSVAGLKTNATSGDMQGYLQFSTNTGSALSEAMRITTNGSVFIATTSEPTGSTGGAGFSIDNNDRANFICATTGTGNLELIEFRNPNGTVGDIKTNGTSTTYNTSSDYRLKENVDYTWDATTRLKQLKPARFNFKVDADTTVDGFLAHEVQDIVPQAVSGEKDGEKMQSIDHSKLVPLLVKTIQELEARITTLEG